MADNIELVHPIYLDVPMMISFVAALQGGYSLENTQRSTRGTAAQASAEGSIGASLPKILSHLFEASARAEASVEGKRESMQESQIVLRHTEASLFMHLRDQLLQQRRVLMADKMTEEEWQKIRPSQLVEMSGFIHRSPINELVQLAERILPFFQQMLPIREDGNVDIARLTPEQSKMIESILLIQGFSADVKSSPIFDAVLEHANGWVRRAVLDLSIDALPLAEQERLLCGQVTVLGKVTRNLGSGESINLYRRSILGYLSPDSIGELEEGLQDQESVNFQLQAPNLEYPAIEILPMAIFV